MTPTEPTKTTETTMTTANLDLAHAYFQAVQTGDMAALGGLLGLDSRVRATCRGAPRPASTGNCRSEWESLLS